MADQQQRTVPLPRASKGRLPNLDVMAYNWVPHKAREVDVGTGGFGVTV